MASGTFAVARRGEAHGSAAQNGVQDETETRRWAQDEQRAAGELLRERALDDASHAKNQVQEDRQRPERDRGG